MVLLTGEGWTFGETFWNCEFIGMMCLRRCDDETHETDEAKKKKRKEKRRKESRSWCDCDSEGQARREFGSLLVTGLIQVLVIQCTYSTDISATANAPFQYVL